MIMDMTINDLQGNFSVLSLETINHLSGHNFSNEDVVQLVNPSYFKQLTKQLYSESNMSRMWIVKRTAFLFFFTGNIILDCRII